MPAGCTRARTLCLCRIAAWPIPAPLSACWPVQSAQAARPCTVAGTPNLKTCIANPKPLRRDPDREATYSEIYSTSAAPHQQQPQATANGRPAPPGPAPKRQSSTDSPTSSPASSGPVSPALAGLPACLPAGLSAAEPRLLLRPRLEWCERMHGMPERQASCSSLQTLMRCVQARLLASASLSSAAQRVPGLRRCLRLSPWRTPQPSLAAASWSAPAAVAPLRTLASGRLTWARSASASALASAALARRACCPVALTQRARMHEHQAPVRRIPPIPSSVVHPGPGTAAASCD